MEPELGRVVRLTSFEEEERTMPALRYWFSRPPEERLAALSTCGDKSMKLPPDFDESFGYWNARGLSAVFYGRIG